MAPADAPHVRPLLRNTCALKAPPSCFVPRLYGSLTASTTAQRPLCEASRCKHGLQQSAQRSKPHFPSCPLLFNGPSDNTVSSTDSVPEAVDMMCKYIFHFGSMSPKGLLADTSRLILQREAEMATFQKDQFTHSLRNSGLSSGTL